MTAAARRCCLAKSEAVLLLLLLLFASIAPAASEESRPSIMFVMADDMGIGDVGAYNPGRLGDTPHMDRLAEESLVLTNFRVMSPVCSPSRASLMTGMESSVAGFPNIADCVASTQYYVDSAGTRRRTLTDSVAWLNESWTSVAHVLRDVGYYTAHFGKWHVGCEADMPPPDAYGWDLAKAWNANPIAWPTYDIKSLWKWLWEDKHKMNEMIVEDFATHVLHDETNGKLFYASINSAVPHAPLSPRREHMEAVGPSRCDLDDFWADGFAWTKETTERYTSRDGASPTTASKRTEVLERRATRQSQACVERVYRASIYSFDVLVGDLLALLGDRAENTLVIVTSDNGPEISSHQPQPVDHTGRWSQVGLASPFRGGKRSLYEGGIRVPFLVRWPAVHGRIGRRVHHDVLGVDLLPTFAEVANAQHVLKRRPDSRRVGRVARVIVGEPHRYDDDIGPSTSWEWAYDMMGPCEIKAPRFAIQGRDTGLKLLLDFAPSPHVRSSSFRRRELYNVTADPYEMYDLLSKSNRRRRHDLWARYGIPLAAELVRWVSDVLPPTAGKMHKYHDPCVGSRTGATDDELL